MTGPLRTYTELSRLDTFEDRYDYLRIGASVGVETFGYDRYLNQQFYHSVEWRRAREKVILRDQACDLGMLDREIFDKILVHHMNPMSREDILTGNETLCDPEFLIRRYTLSRKSLRRKNKCACNTSVLLEVQDAPYFRKAYRRKRF